MLRRMQWMNGLFAHMRRVCVDSYKGTFQSYGGGWMKHSHPGEVNRDWAGFMIQPALLRVRQRRCQPQPSAPPHVWVLSCLSCHLCHYIYLWGILTLTTPRTRVVWEKNQDGDLHPTGAQVVFCYRAVLRSLPDHSGPTHTSTRLTWWWGGLA